MENKTDIKVYCYKYDENVDEEWKNGIYILIKIKEYKKISNRIKYKTTNKI
jgi:hypothetical protein